MRFKILFFSLYFESVFSTVIIIISVFEVSRETAKQWGFAIILNEGARRNHCYQSGSEEQIDAH